MFYTHEQQERRPQTKPMNTELPARACNTADFEFFDQYLRSRQLSVTLAKANGWFPSWEAGDGYPRCVIPAVTHKAGHVYWQARDMTGKAKRRYQSPEGPRHEALIVVNPPGRVNGMNGQVVVEGPMDALAAAGAGYTGFALMGMMPSLATLMHLGLLLDDEQDVLVLLDRDSTNENVRITTTLASNEFNVRAAIMPSQCKDLASLEPKQRSQLLAGMFAQLF